VVTNSGANILSAVKTTFGNKKHLPCLFYTFNLITQGALDNHQNVQNIISRIKSIVTFFKQSVSTSDQLKNLSDLKLKQLVATRRNSVFYIIDWFLLCLCSNQNTSILINIR